MRLMKIGKTFSHLFWGKSIKNIIFCQGAEYRLSEKGVQTLVWQNQAKAGRFRPNDKLWKSFLNGIWERERNALRLATLR